MSEPENREAGIPPELKALEADLATLRPRSDRLDRDRLMFLAGQASAGRPVPPRRNGVRRIAAWAATMAATAAAAVALTLVLGHPSPRGVERVVYVPAATVSPHQVAGAPPIANSAAASPHALASTPEEDSPLLVGGLVGWTRLGPLLPGRTRIPARGRTSIDEPSQAAAGIAIPGDGPPRAASPVLSRGSLNGLLKDITGMESRRLSSGGPLERGAQS